MLTNLIRQLFRTWRPHSESAGRALGSGGIAGTLARGIERQRVGNLQEAESTFRSALDADRHNVDAMHLLGGVLSLQGKLEEAEAVLQLLITRRPKYAEAHFTLAGVMHARGDLEGSARHYRRAIESRPDLAAAYVNLSSILRLQDEMAAAIDCLQTAIRLDPGDAAAHHNLGKALYECGAIGEALPRYERALALQPDSADMRYNYAEALLVAGELARGWQEYESRFDQSDGAPHRRPFRHRYWRGEDLTDKTLLVWGEQGVGDEILFAGLYEELVARGGRCVFEVSAKLQPLVSRSFPNAQVVPRTEPPHPLTRQGIDYQAPAGSLGRHLRPGVEHFPRRAGYLVADEGRVKYWRRRLAEEGSGTYVGFAWRSSNLQGKRALSCTALEQWGELFAVPGVRWICLQYDDCERELAAARRRYRVKLARFEGVDYFDDLDEVAALMKALDLVICAPTVTSVHAAALGVEVWQMTYGVDWQTHGTQGNLWFPSMVQFQRRQGQDWSEMLAHVARALRARIGNG